MKIHITETKTSASKQRLHGECVYLDTKFTFAVHSAFTSKDYSHVLHLAIISPSTNKILQMSGRKKKAYIKKQQEKLARLESSLKTLDPNSTEYQTKSKQKEVTTQLLADLNSGKRLDALNCQQEVYLQKSDERTIRKAVNQAVPQLFGNFQNEISVGLKQAGSTENLHTLTAFTLHADDSLAIPLVKGCRMSMDRLLEITWGELQINGDQIQIPEFKDNFTGATLNYIHPPLGETAYFLQTITRRDCFFFSTGKQPPTSSVAEEEDYITYTISAEDCAQILGVQSKAPIFLPKGSEVTIEGDYGVSGIITFAPEEEDSLMPYPQMIYLY